MDTVKDYHQCMDSGVKTLNSTLQIIAEKCDMK